MLKLVVQLLDTQYLNKTIKTTRKKRFRLTSWIMEWGFLQTYRSIKTIKDNIRTLQEQSTTTGSDSRTHSLLKHNLWTCLFKQICHN